MTPMRMAAAMFRPDFLQAMVLCTGVFLIPLEHRPRWKIRLALAAAVGFVVGGILTIIYQQTGEGYLSGAFWPGMAFQMVYFLLPVMASYLVFRLCSTISRADAVYGTACVYAVQHTEFCISIILVTLFPEQWPQELNWLLLAAALALSHWLLARQLQQGGHYSVSWGKALMVMGLMAMIGMVLNFPFRFLPGLRDAYSYPLGLAYDMCSCQFLLWLQLEQRREINLAASAETERRLRIQMQDQYRLSQENIDIINRKCHNLKHQVSALRFVTNPTQREQSLQELERSAMIYDASVNTGNRVLDTVLTEKSLLCESRHITWTCMAEGKLLDFLSPVDMYTLFGNALDNAIEASMSLPEEVRNVSVTVRRQMGSVFIQVENYFSRPLRMEGGKLLSTKKDAVNHGYGLESIRQVAARYGGTVDISTQEDIFTLSILLPLPQQ